MSEPKFCKDCKWFYFEQSHPGDPWGEKCVHPMFKWNLVTGEKGIQDSLSCYEMREAESYCGFNAKYFEPKGGSDE